MRNGVRSNRLEQRPVRINAKLDYALLHTVTKASIPFIMLHTVTKAIPPSCRNPFSMLPCLPHVAIQFHSAKRPFLS